MVRTVTLRLEQDAYEELREAAAERRCRISSPPPPWSGSGRRSSSTTRKWPRFCTTTRWSGDRGPVPGRSREPSSRGSVDRGHRRVPRQNARAEPGLQAAWRLPGPSSRARLSRRRSGFSRRFKVAWVGLCRGWIARSTFGLAICACSANSFTPIARITFPKAVWIGTPSSMAARRKSRANSGSRRSCASPSFQSRLRRAMSHFLPEQYVSQMTRFSAGRRLWYSDQTK